MAAILVLMGMLVSGCVRDHVQRCCQGTESIRLEFFTRQSTLTKSADQLTDASVAETALNSIQIWVFDSGGGAQSPAGYKELGADEISRLTDFYGTLSVIVPLQKTLLSGVNKVDIYVAANTSSVGVTLSQYASRSELEASEFGYNSFGPENSVNSVPSDGLPISRIVRNIDLSANIRIPLVRAVSKIRFFLVKPEGLSGSTISSIELDGGSIPNSEYFFPRPAEYSDDIQSPSVANIVAVDGYSDSKITMTPRASDIYGYAAPEALTKGDAESTQEYVSRLYSAGISDFGTCYLRESDKTISGTIKYTTSQTGDDVLSASFSLDAGKFVRNHEWIVYAYFTRDRLYLRPIVAPWTDGGNWSYGWGYSNSLTNHTDLSSSGIINISGQDRIMTACGMNSSGLPRSPKLQIDARSMNPTSAKMKLMLDNPDFGLIVDNGGSLSAIMDSVDIPLSETGTSTVFYVVPKHHFDLAGSNPENPDASLQMYLITESLAAMRLPFNTLSLPGDQESILYRYVTPDQFD